MTAEGGAEGPLVSVVMPVFDGERYLPDAIEGVLAQDHRPLELIVVDNASSDSSAAIAESYEDVRTIRRERNGGPSGARNSGIQAARGELVALHDADDVSPPGRLGAQVAYLAEHPSAGCVIGREEIVLEPGATMPRWLQGPRIAAPGVAAEAPTYPVMTAMVRREVLDRVGGFDESLGYGDDLDWMMRLHEAVEVGKLDRVLIRRRFHEGNLTHDFEAMRAAMTAAMRARIERKRGQRAGAR
jgi:glycosyltransferase involved in cell wall biosynthesis